MKTIRQQNLRLAAIAFVAALGAAAQTAAAVEWSAVANTDVQTVLVDRDSVHAYNGDVRAWVVHSYNQTESLGDMFPHRSKVILYSFACDKREMGYIQWSMQSGQFGGGQTVWADRANQVTLFGAGTDAADNALVDGVCQQYARMNSPTYAANR